MDVETVKATLLSSPVFLLDATEIVANLSVLKSLRQQCGVKILYSIKALPTSVVLEIAKPFVDGFSVSSLSEARLAHHILGRKGEIHLTTPGIRPDEIAALAGIVTHINFNSLTQHQQFVDAVKVRSSIGLRVNPKLSFAKDTRFDPCRKHSKLGVDIDTLWLSNVVDQVQGLHIHTVFSALDFMPLLKTVAKLREYMSDKLAKLAWLNLGGGYLFAEIKDHKPFIDLVLKLRNDFAIEVYIEPGKAVVGKAGYLVATVLDSFVSDGKTIAILDTSVNHNPEVFEYQRQPELHEHDELGKFPVILAGCTCLAGDVFGEYHLKEPLKIGDKVVFKNVGAYSLIKANRFNGYGLPSVYMWDGQKLDNIKQDSYQNYCQQWLVNGVTPLQD
ncbi:Orn/DAP/Arg decarboxylase 2 [Crenothrix polyspora]|uniref:Carboxynorspermidine/carboxyspermidine decarboxylase n=1 Tax=Crenothrix polyspora TaxID=360316 RepID=A0A1R4H1J0_9GAMM|nr:carboxynorspermidine decarboxylase [Crenothrix polyspora]SJM90127.1 Orn/DAP/Arg decarboxylase 2 [Crenothrix polyspora]